MPPPEAFERDGRGADRPSGRAFVSEYASRPAVRYGLGSDSERSLPACAAVSPPCGIAHRHRRRRSAARLLDRHSHTRDDLT